MGKTFSVQPFVVGIALGALLATAWFYGHPSNTISQTTPVANTTGIAPATTTVRAVLPTDRSGALSVSDQAAGSAVRVESVTVPPPGVWIAVREVENGQLGNILGAVRAKGPRSNFSVPLLRNTKPGTTYAAELYRDNGDELFNAASDSAYVDFASDQVVTTYFTTTE